MLASPAASSTGYVILATVLQLMGIKLVDHIIVAENDATSMADSVPFAPYLDPNAPLELLKVADEM